MISFGRQMIVLVLCFILVMPLLNCGKPKEGKVAVSEQEFSMRQDGSHKLNWVVDAKGKIKNIGEVDVKNVEVTGFCLSCQEAWINGQWLVSSGLEKMPNQKATIAYLPIGAEEEFSFTEVAFMMTGEPPKSLPDKLECKVVSFETVQ